MPLFNHHPSSFPLFYCLTQVLSTICLNLLIIGWVALISTPLLSDVLSVFLHVTARSWGQHSVMVKSIAPGPRLPAFWALPANCLLTLGSVTHLLIYKAGIIIVTTHEVIERMKWVIPAKHLEQCLICIKNYISLPAIIIILQSLKTIWIENGGYLDLFFSDSKYPT